MEQEKNHIQDTNSDVKQATVSQAEQKQAEAQTAEAKQTAPKATTSYAVRPEHRHHRKLAFSNQDNMLQTRNYLNIAFMLIAIVGVIMWTQMEENRTPAIVVLIIAVAVKIAEVCIRLFKK